MTQKWKSLLASLSHEAKIGFASVLTSAMFLLEIIAGYSTGSIALIADSFHMLSDLLALGIAFYSIRLAKQRKRQANFTFGFLRAEVLGAFANAVFLLALCFTIILDAIERFVEPKEIDNPKIVLIVGAAGLFANLLALVLFGGHVGHSHGGHDHDHAYKPARASEELPATTASPLLNNHGKSFKPDRISINSHSRSHLDASNDLDDIAVIPPSPIVHYAAQTRAVVIATADRMRNQTENSDFSVADFSLSRSSTNRDALATVISVNDKTANELQDHNSHHHSHNHKNEHDHNDHDHEHGHGHVHGHGHDHGNMNMHGIFLHVLGDALGSIGVIISSLVIMYADGSWRFYMDPAISVLISGLIISSAVPLVRSASFILLQGVPTSISVARLREQILAIDGVLGVHELHVWGLSDNRNVASVHVRVVDPTSPIVGRNDDNDDDPRVRARPYMEVAAAIKRLMHGYGVHSTTVQPEFVRVERRRRRVVRESADGLLREDDEEEIVDIVDDDMGCLLKCESAACNEQLCCPDDLETVTNIPRAISPSGHGGATTASPVELQQRNKSAAGRGFLLSQGVSDSGAKFVPFKKGKKDNNEHHDNHDNHSHGHSHEHGSKSHDHRHNEAHSEQAPRNHEIHSHSHDNGHDHHH